MALVLAIAEVAHLVQGAVGEVLGRASTLVDALADGRLVVSHVVVPHIVVPHVVVPHVAPRVGAAVDVAALLHPLVIGYRFLAVARAPLLVCRVRRLRAGGDPGTGRCEGEYEFAESHGISSCWEATASAVRFTECGRRRRSLPRAYTAGRAPT